jgi:integrase
VFSTNVGTPLDPSHVRRDFRIAIKGADGVDPSESTPRELRHSFVSLLSDDGVSLEEISRLVGHKNTAVTELVYPKQIRPVSLEEISRLVGHKSTAVTELVYRKQIRPVIQSGAVAMDGIFGAGRER